VPSSCSPGIRLAVNDNFEARGWTEKELRKARAWTVSFLGLETISEGFEMSTMLATGTAPAADVLDFLNNLLKIGRYQLDGKLGPKTNPEAWLLAVLENNFKARIFPNPLAARKDFQ
jgi:hypothetical protein